MFIFSLILLMVFIFGGLAFFLRHLLTRNISSATSHLQRMLKDTEGKEEKIKKKIEEAEKQCKEILEKAEKEAFDLKEKAVKDMNEERDKIIEEAHRQSDELIERAHKTCDAIKQELEENIKKQAIDFAEILACRAIPENLKNDMHIIWLDSLIANGIEGLDRLTIPRELHELQLHTAFALTDEQRTQLKSKLEEILERELEIKEEVNPELVAGVIIKMGNLEFNGSFSVSVKDLADKIYQEEDE